MVAVFDATAAGSCCTWWDGGNWLGPCGRRSRWTLPLRLNIGCGRHYFDTDGMLAARTVFGYERRTEPLRCQRVPPEAAEYRLRGLAGKAAGAERGKPVHDDRFAAVVGFLCGQIPPLVQGIQDGGLASCLLQQSSGCSGIGGRVYQGQETPSGSEPGICPPCENADEDRSGALSSHLIRTSAWFG